MDKLPPINHVLLRQLNHNNVYKIFKKEAYFQFVIPNRIFYPLKKQVETKKQHKQYWKNVQKEIQCNNEYIYIPIIINEVYLILIEMKDDPILLELFDLKFIMQQIQHNVFDFYYFISSLGNYLKTQCAPVRDKLIEKMIDEKDYTKILKLLFVILEIMKIDLANHFVKQLTKF